MRKYDYNTIKTELEKRLKDTQKRLMVYERVGKCLQEHNFVNKNVDKRILDIFKQYFTDTNFELYYHNENETWKQEKYIKIYYSIDRERNYINYDNYEEITLFYMSKISNTIEKTIEDLLPKIIETIEYIKGKIEIIKTDLTDLETKVNEFNNLMEQVDNLLNKYKNTELHYLLQVKEY